MVEGGVVKEDGQVCSSSRLKESVCLSARLPFSERWWAGITSSRAHAHTGLPLNT